MRLAIALALAAAAAAARTPEEKALDEQDRGALEKLADGAMQKADAKAGDFALQLKGASIQSMLAQLAIELGDKGLGRRAAETGMRAARRAAGLKDGDAEAHRLLGTLCGQVIPGNVLMGVKYGRCAMDEVKRAAELSPKSAMVWLSRGVGNYYLPSAFGGGVNLAIGDFDKAIQLDAKLAEAHLWRGIALRKAGRNGDARKALARALELNPNRKWARQQMEKTPAQ